jgi:hypothetical protein
MVALLGMGIAERGRRGFCLGAHLWSFCIPTSLHVLRLKIPNAVRVCRTVATSPAAQLLYLSELAYVDFATAAAAAADDDDDDDDGLAL